MNVIRRSICVLSRQVPTLLYRETLKTSSSGLILNKGPNQRCVSLSSIKMSSDQKIATYEEVKALPKHPEKLLIDVREPDELKEFGQIPTSINIPLKTVKKELELSPAEFKGKYGREKPSKTSEIIFHCLKGGRAAKATETAQSLGFVNARNYLGSWSEWAEKEGLNKK